MESLLSGKPGAVQTDLPAWFAALRKRDGISALWSEIDLEAQLRIIPKKRMKAQREHRVPLTAEAVALLKALPRVEGSDFVFPAARGGAPSDMTLSAVMRRMQDTATAKGGKGWLDPRSGRPVVPHGLRSVFRDHCAERGVDRDMADWAAACRGALASGVVVPMRGAV